MDNVERFLVFSLSVIALVLSIIAVGMLNDLNREMGEFKIDTRHDFKIKIDKMAADMGFGYLPGRRYRNAGHYVRSDSKEFKEYVESGEILSYGCNGEEN